MSLAQYLDDGPRIETEEGDDMGTNIWLGVALVVLMIVASVLRAIKDARDRRMERQRIEGWAKWDFGDTIKRGRR